VALDLTKPITPPRKNAPRRQAPKTDPNAQTPRAANRTEKLTEQTGAIVGILLILNQYADAGAVAVHAPNIARELANVAEDHEKIGDAIDKIIAVGPYAGLFMAVMPLGMQLAVNHGVIKNPEMLAGVGVVPKEVIEARGKAKLAEMQTEALMQLQAAEAERNAILASQQNGAKQST
jgi:hypothetical protein